MKKKKVKHYNTKQIEMLETVLVGQQQLLDTLLLRNSRLKHKEAAMRCQVLAQGDSIAGHGLCLSIIEQAVEQQDEGSKMGQLIAESLAQALAYDLHVHDMMSRVGSCEADLRSSRCLQAALTPGRVQLLLGGMDGCQLAQQFKALSLQLAAMLVTQHLDELSPLQQQAPPAPGAQDATFAASGSSGTAVASSAALGNTDDEDANSSSTSRDATEASWEALLLEYMGLIILAISVQDTLLMQVAVTNMETGDIQPPPLAHWEAVAAALAKDMEPAAL